MLWESKTPRSSPWCPLLNTWLTITGLDFRRNWVYSWDGCRDSSWISFLSQIRFKSWPLSFGKNRKYFNFESLKEHMQAKSLSRIQLFVTQRTVACQAPLSMGFPRKEFWSGLPCLPPGDLPNPGIEPTSVPHPHPLYHWHHLGGPSQSNKIHLYKYASYTTHTHTGWEQVHCFTWWKLVLKMTEK